MILYKYFLREKKNNKILSTLLIQTDMISSQNSPTFMTFCTQFAHASHTFFISHKPQTVVLPRRSRVVPPSPRTTPHTTRAVDAIRHMRCRFSHTRFACTFRRGLLHCATLSNSPIEFSTFVTAVPHPMSAPMMFTAFWMKCAPKSV